MPVSPVSYETFCGDGVCMMDNGCIVLHLPNAIAPNTPTIQPILMLKEFSPYRPGLLPKLPQRIPPLYRHHFRASTNIRSGWSAPLPHRKPFGVQESGTFLPEPCFRKPTPFPGFDRYGQQYVCRHLMASFAAALTGYCRQYRVHPPPSQHRIAQPKLSPLPKNHRNIPHVEAILATDVDNIWPV